MGRKKSHWGPALLVAAALGACASAPARTVVEEGYVGGRVVRYVLEPSTASTQETGPLVDLNLVVCDQTEGGVESRCVESVILRNVGYITRDGSN